MVFWLSKDIILPCLHPSTLPAREGERGRVPGQANLPKWRSVNCFFVLFFFQAVAYKKG